MLPSLLDDTRVGLNVPSKYKPVVHRAAVPLLLLVLVVQLALSVRQQAQTYDEGFHLTAAYRYWQCGDFGMNSEHPPLVKLVAAAPLWLGRWPAPAGECGREPTTKDYGYALGLKYVFGQGLDADALLFRARIAAALFGVVLAIACYFTAKTLFGRSAALIALVLLVFEPNILAHGALITTDTAVSAFMMLAVLAFYRYARVPTLAGVVLGGVLVGLELASKHSGVLIFPVLCGVCACDLLLGRRGERRTRVLVLGLVAMFAISLLVLWSVYGFRYNARPNGQAMTMPPMEFLKAVQEQGTTGPIVTTIIPGLVRYHVLPEAYLYGFVDVLSVTHPGQPPFILGKLYAHGKWFYFPLTFVIKSTLGFLALCVLAAVAVRWRRERLMREVLYVIVPVAVVLVAGMESGLNIGYRHVLPIIGFLCVLGGATAVEVARRSPRWKLAVAVLVVAHVASSLHAFPNYIPYANEAWGGPSKTYKYLTDANVDWGGNGVKQLAQYLSRHGIRDCWMAYDGALNLEYYNIKCRMMPGNIGDAPPEVPPMQASGTFVVSALTMSGIEWEPGELNPYRAFLETKPDEVIAGGMLMYRGSFDLNTVVAASHIARALKSMSDHCAAAVVEAQGATELTPQSVRGHLVLGQALAACNRNEEARRELQTALDLAKARPEWYPLQIADAQRGLRAVGAGQ